MSSERLYRPEQTNLESDLLYKTNQKNTTANKCDNPQSSEYNGVRSPINNIGRHTELSRNEDTTSLNLLHAKRSGAANNLNFNGVVSKGIDVQKKDVSLKGNIDIFASFIDCFMIRFED